MEWRNISKRKKEIFSLLKPGVILVLFDTETTGLNSEAKIIQFSGIRYLVNPDYTFTEQSLIDTYINPEMELPPKITGLTGITDEMLATARTEKELAPVIYDFLDMSDVWGAYNKSFDLRMLKQMSDRTRLMYMENPSIDVLEMARDIIPKSEVDDHKLGTVTTYLFPDDNTQFHSAIEDVRATARVMQELLQRYIAFEDKEKKIPVHLEKAGIFVNPHAQSQQRIRLMLNTGDYGDIYYDIVKKVWSCKATPKAKKLFESIDMADLERQVLEKYGYWLGYQNMDEIARAWLKFSRENKKRA